MKKTMKMRKYKEGSKKEETTESKKMEMGEDKLNKSKKTIRKFAKMK